MHKINLHQIENEALIKQIDIADAKTREKDDELRIQAQEHERKLKLQLERIMMRREKNEEREIFDLKSKHSIEKEELQQKIDDAAEEMDYYKQKSDKLEIEMKNIRLGKGDGARVKALEEEIKMLKLELE